jgi:hypothetical protein
LDLCWLERFVYWGRLVALNIKWAGTFCEGDVMGLDMRQITIRTKETDRVSISK